MICCAVNHKYTYKIDQSDPNKWDYNNTFTNVELPDARSLARLVYKGHPFCPQHKHEHGSFVNKEGKLRRTSYRTQENFTGTNIIAIDLDDETSRCAIPSLLMEPFVFSYSSFLYSTVSSTPDKHRTRIVFECEKVITDPEYYRTAVTSLIHQFGSDKSCSDIVKIYAGSKKCEVEFVEKVLPATLLDSAVASVAASEAARRARRQYEVERLVEEGNINPGRIRDALRSIPSSKEQLSYHDWQRIIAAVHSVFPDEAGIAICLEWSANRNEDEIPNMFRSYNSHTGSVAKIGTLFWIAKQYGWQGAMQFDSHEQRVDYVFAKMLRRVD